MAGTGYNIVFGGPDFRPSDFLASTKMRWHVTHKGSVLCGERVAEESWVEHDDSHPGDYPLDMVTEALDQLQAHRSEYLRVSQFPGVVTRSLNFYENSRSPYFTFTPDDIALLHELRLTVSCIVLAVDQAAP